MIKIISTNLLSNIGYDSDFNNFYKIEIVLLLNQVCRLAYEIMNAKHVDASRKFQSLDDIYYYGGQNEHKVKATMEHKARNREEIDLKVGDELAIAGNHWDGYSKAFSHRMRMEGTFPSFKVEEVINIADFSNSD